MKSLSDIEKELLSKMLEHPMLAQQEAVRPICVLEDNYIGPNHDVSMIMDSTKRILAISYEPKNPDDTRPIMLITRFFLLLQQLEEEKMIVLLSDDEKLVGALGEQYKDGKLIKLPDAIAKLGFRYLNNLILISEDLAQYIRNGYRTQESVRHHRAFLVTIIALAASILFGIWGIWKDVAPEDQPSNAQKTEANKALDPTPAAAPRLAE